MVSVDRLSSIPLTQYLNPLSIETWNNSLTIVLDYLNWFSLWVIFRWFKFTLKPPYTVAHGNLSSAIWDTSHWTSFVKFGLKTAWDISYDIFWPILKYVNFWQLQGHLRNLWKKDAFRKSIFSRWRSDKASMRLGGGVLGGQVPRLYGGTIFGGVWHTWGIRWGI